LLIDRRTWWLGYGMGMLAVIGGVLAVIAILDVAGMADFRSEMPASVLFTAAAACGLVAAAMLVTYRRYRALPLDDVRHAVVIDPQAGLLRERRGDVLAELDSVRVAVRIDWWTRGWMRLVVLAWPGGRRIVFRTSRRERARDVAESLREALGA